MKVVFIHFCFEDYSIELINSLSECVDLTVIQPDNVYFKCRPYIKSTVKVEYFKKYRIRDPRNLFSMKSMVQMVKRINPDILHVQETNDPWYDLTHFTNHSFPLVTTIHDVYRHPGDGDLIPGSDFTRRIAIFRSKQLIVHGCKQKKQLHQRFPELSDRVNVIPHGELGTLYKRFIDQHHAIPREQNSLLFFGRIWPYKGLSYLLKAMSLVIKEVPDVRLTIAGLGENLDQYSHILSDEKHFTVLNRFIPPAEVTKLFLQSTAVVLPYVEASQSGVASLAFGLGTPIIASNVGGFSEMIHHSKDGLLVPPCDVDQLAKSIIYLLKNRQIQHRMKVATSTRCETDLKWSNIASQTLKVYQKIGRQTALVI
ncbi:glycosyltransferase family 4 protein [Acaryochloris sp. IP29b_bin.148]|uniref:glycosyltransferase family 4 protein n=1 Tax=Acaryochloris sp. IP29b_bin.148 TaxID=2969218 RepID=UPI0026336662|nr:glycosyltransferase family 4 protein [Acaryochloris sp. IP29b_bin.148]